MDGWNISICVICIMLECRKTSKWADGTTHYPRVTLSNLVEKFCKKNWKQNFTSVSCTHLVLSVYLLPSGKNANVPLSAPLLPSSESLQLSSTFELSQDSCTGYPRIATHLSVPDISTGMHKECNRCLFHPKSQPILCI